MRQKSYQKSIILLLTFAIAVLFSQAGTALAQDNSIPTALQNASCADFSGVARFLACPVLTALSWVVYAILVVVSALFAVFGLLFDSITALTLDPRTYNVPAIYQGWTIARDTANLFFIFILLTIAIATILQIETYGAKQLLPKLIIAALFINFSFLLSQYVIFAANSMTGFFLPGAGTKERPSAQLSVMFLQGLQPGEMFKSSKISLKDIPKIQKQLTDVRGRITSYGDEIDFDEFEELEKQEKQLRQQLETAQKDLSNSLLQLVIAMSGTIVFILVAMFALAFAALSLLIRVVILWFLMILSPIAFLFWVVPGLSSHASKWWNELLKQAFFAPAFFFLFGIAVTMIRQETVRDLLKVKPIESAFVTSFTTIGYYTLLVVMLIASVLVAKSMGGVAAQWADKGAKAARGALLGSAVLVGKAGLKNVGRFAERVGTDETKGTVMRQLSRIPLVGGMMGGVAVRAIERTKRAGGLEEIRKRQAETLKSLAPAEKAVYAAGLTLPARESLLNSISEADIAKMLMAPGANQDSINAGVARLNRDKQENVRLEQFNRTPQAQQANFFNGLPEDMQRVFVRDGKLSSRSAAELYQSNIGNIRQNINSHLDGATEETREKFTKEYAELLGRMADNNEKANSFSSLSDNQKRAWFNTADEKQLGQLASAFDNVNRGTEFITQVNTLSGARVPDTLKAVPHLAADVGKTFEEMVSKIDFKTVSKNIIRNAGHIQNMVERASLRQVKDIVARNDEITNAYEERMQNLFNGLNQNIDDLADFFERNNNAGFARALRRNRELRRMLGFPT